MWSWTASAASTIAQNADFGFGERSTDFDGFSLNAWEQLVGFVMQPRITCRSLQRSQVPLGATSHRFYGIVATSTWSHGDFSVEVWQTTTIFPSGGPMVRKRRHRRLLSGCF